MPSLIFLACGAELYPMEEHLNELLGPSIFLLILDMMLGDPCQWMNLREIARRIDKNPGSVSPVMPGLVERGLVEDCKVGKVSVVYRLRTEDSRVQALMRLKESLKASA
jgi:DNA-binding IclR family transcriptional regulator